MVVARIQLPSSIVTRVRAAQRPDMVECALRSVLAASPQERFALMRRARPLMKSGHVPLEFEAPEPLVREFLDYAGKSELKADVLLAGALLLQLDGPQDPAETAVAASGCPASSESVDHATREGGVRHRPPTPPAATADHDVQLGASMFDAFRRGDYARCIDVFGQWTRSPDAGALHALLIPNQILLIALQRLGDPASSEQLGRAMVTMREGAASHYPIAGPKLRRQCDFLRLTLGAAELGTVMETLDNDDERCRACVYAGARSLTLGRTDEARVLFERACAFRAAPPEREMAKFELARISV